MIIISGAIKLFQEGRSSKASEKLKQMIKTTTAIKRNGVVKELPMEEVLPGDIIKLSAGDMIPADLRIISARDLFITQSALTGESEPIEKFSYSITDEISSALECNNLRFMGTSVSSGSAIGIVIHTGKNTFFGSIAKALNKKTPKSNFDKGIASVS
jgi:Mg2+-importing ATPase